MLFIKFSYRKDSASAYKIFRNHLFSLNFPKDYERRILNFRGFYDQNEMFTENDGCEIFDQLNM